MHSRLAPEAQASGVLGLQAWATTWEHHRFSDPLHCFSTTAHGVVLLLRLITCIWHFYSLPPMLSLLYSGSVQSYGLQTRLQFHSHLRTSTRLRSSSNLGSCDSPDKFTDSSDRKWSHYLVSETVFRILLRSDENVYAPFGQCCWIQAQLPHFQGCVCCLWLAFPFISTCQVARLWSYSLFICSFISYVSVLKKSSFLAEENNFSTSTIAVHTPWHDRYPTLPECIFVLVYTLKYIWKDE